MKLADLATGSDWIVWIVFVIFAALSITLLSGHGSWFISGYNTATKEEKEKYDEKKLCRTMGIGMSIIAILASSSLLQLPSDSTSQWTPLLFSYILPCYLGVFGTFTR